MTKTLTQKIVAIATTLTVTGMLAAPVYGLTTAELQVQIDALLAQLSTLQTQLSAMGGSAAACTFTRSLYLGVSGADVKCLQQYLNGAGFPLAGSGVGSPGNETQYYGGLSKAAAAAWQLANGVSLAGTNGGTTDETTGGTAGDTTGGTTGGVVVGAPGVEAIVSTESAPSPST